MPRGTFNGQVVLERLRAAGPEKRDALWRRQYAGRPVAGVGRHIRVEAVPDPMGISEDDIAAFELDVDGDGTADIRCLFFEGDPDRVPMFNRYERVRYEGRLHDFETSAGPVMLVVGAHRLLLP